MKNEGEQRHEYRQRSLQIGTLVFRYSFETPEKQAAP